MAHDVGALPCVASKTRSGGVCKRLAGSITDHVEFGTCRHRGGKAKNGVM
jgi:hypothetical protein